ncbi:MAG: peptidase MA family metallohydrolase [Planctomycetota bacterium]
MFLPRILLLVCILLLASACGDRPRPAVARNDIAEVVVGTGDVPDHVLAEVRERVAVELPPLQVAFGDLEVQKFFVFVHRSRDTMPAELVAGLHEDSPGFALLGRHQIHLVWGELLRTGTSLRGVVVHELVHELLDQYVAPNGRFVPRWFHEGLAQCLAGDTYLGVREEDIVWRVATSSLLRFGDIDESFPTETAEVRLAYAQSYSYVAWLLRTYGLDLLLRIAHRADRLTSFGRALVGATQRDSLQLEGAWHDYVLHESGAPWRVALGQWFGLSLIAVLPVLVLALRRRLAADDRARRHLEARAAADQRAAELRAAAAAEAAAWAAAQPAQLEDARPEPRDDAGPIG